MCRKHLTVKCYIHKVVPLTQILPTLMERYKKKILREDLTEFFPNYKISAAFILNLKTNYRKKKPPKI